MSEKEKKEIAEKDSDRQTFSNKRVMTSVEVAEYLGISLSRLYKMTWAREIPHYKPNGKMNYFDRDEVEAWALRNRIATNEELNSRAQALAGMNY